MGRSRHLQDLVVDWPVLRNGVLRRAPGFLPGSCCFLFNLNHCGVEWGEGSGLPPVAASEALSKIAMLPGVLGASLKNGFHVIMALNDRVENSHQVTLAQTSSFLTTSRCP